MPLPHSVKRREIHHRTINMKAFVRDDGMYEVESHLVDTKPFDFTRLGSVEPVAAGQPLHDLWIRLTIDDQFIVRHIDAASDITPFRVCKEAESTLAVLIGERIASGWSKRVKNRLHGAASCTHLMEMLIPLATTALQGIRGLLPDRHSAVDAAGVPRKLDSCYAFGRDREIVKWLWPQHYRKQASPDSDRDSHEVRKPQ